MHPTPAPKRYPRQRALVFGLFGLILGAPALLYMVSVGQALIGAPPAPSGIVIPASPLTSAPSERACREELAALRDHLLEGFEGLGAAAEQRGGAGAEAWSAYLSAWSERHDLAAERCADYPALGEAGDTLAEAQRLLSLLGVRLFREGGDPLQQLRRHLGPRR